MSRLICALSALLLLVQFAYVVPNAAAQEAQKVPFTGHVVDARVAIRSGAGRSFYVVGHLTHGSQVKVDEVVFGWYKITPPEGTYSFISKAFVDTTDEDPTGTVNTNRATIRTASINGTAQSYRRQIDLLRGDTVQIVSEEGSFYKIVPPNGAYVFLPPGSVSPLGSDAGRSFDTAPRKIPDKVAAPRVDQSGRLPEISPPSADLPTQTLAKQTQDSRSSKTGQAHIAATNTPPSKTPGKIQLGTGLGAQSAALKAAEQRMIDAQTLPLEQRPIEALLNTYRALAKEPGLSLVDGRIVSMRIAQLRQSAQIAKTLQTIAAAQQAHQEVRRFADQLPPELPKTRYDVRGQLLTSGVYNGKNLPRLYRVTEANGHRVIAYVRLHPAVEVAPLLGQYVGIVGQMKYDPMIKLEVIEAEHVDVISATASR